MTTNIADILARYRNGKLSRLDELAELRVTSWPEVGALLQAFVDGDGAGGGDAHLRYSALQPLHTSLAKLDRARLSRALVELLPSARDSEDLLELLTEVGADVDDGAVDALVTHARACFARRGVHAVWDHRYAFEVLWKLDKRDDVVLPFLTEVVRALIKAKRLHEDGTLFSAAASAIEYLGKRAPAHDDAIVALLTDTIARGQGETTRAATSALLALVEQERALSLLQQAVDALLRKRALGDRIFPDAIVDALQRVRADWFPILLRILDSDAAFTLLACDCARLMRSSHATPARLAALRTLTTSTRPATAQAARDLLALARPRNDVAARIVRYSRLPALISRNVYETDDADGGGAGAGIVHDGALWLPLQRIVQAAPPDEWANDEETLGIARVDASDSARDRVWMLPVTLPMSPNGAAGDKRILRIVDVDGERAIATLREGFADDSGWGSRNFVLQLSLANGAWSVLRHDAPARTLHTELRASDAWCGGELVAWIERGKLRTHADATPYFLDDWTQARATTRARRRARSAKPAPESGAWLHGLDDVVRAEAAARVNLDEPELTRVAAAAVGDCVMLAYAASDADTGVPLADLVVTVRRAQPQRRRRRRASAKSAAASSDADVGGAE